MSKKVFWGVFLVAMGLAGVRISLVSAQNKTPITDDQVNEVARQLYCPVCENIPLEVCSTTACAQWRDLIREKLSQGWTADQIKEYFVTQYGDRVLAQPPKHGLNWLIYVVPPIVILVALVLLLRSMRKMHTSSSIPPTSTSPSTDEYLTRVEEELRQRKEKS
jgi:cytochrome c-type biogenesis protein CcmH